MRREKLAELQANGQNPFEITKYDVTHHSQEVKDNFDELEGKHVVHRRTYDVQACDGKSIFLQCAGSYREISSAYVARDSIGEESYKAFQEDGYR